MGRNEKRWLHTSEGAELLLGGGLLNLDINTPASMIRYRPNADVTLLTSPPLHLSSNACSDAPYVAIASPHAIAISDASDVTNTLTKLAMPTRRPISQKYEVIFRQT